MLDQLLTREIKQAVVEALREHSDTDGRVAPRYFTLEQAGQYIGGISAEAVRFMVRKKELPASHIGSRLFISREDIDDLMRRRRL